MSDQLQSGVLYIEYGNLAVRSDIPSLWSYRTWSREPGRPPVNLRPDGLTEYWLRSDDPLLNTILPGTGVAVVLNAGETWSAGRSLDRSALLPRAFVAGPVTQSKFLRLGKRVLAIGAGIEANFTPLVFGVFAPDLVDKIIPLEEFWTPNAIDQIFASLSRCQLGRSSACSSRSCSIAWPNWTPHQRHLSTLPI